ncbi:LETM1-related biofilm-associated protein [uncultured Croceitalea sp.]|uniref:LETM1-related biofilm-associated protein n=1 Tax=uncultured Croceitalea sp. TaxID=1798908 RepID=UPI00374ED1AE
MNPSASGWISKFGSLSSEYSNSYANFDSLYQDLLVNGFIYGIHLAVPSFIETEHELSEDEVAKINLLSALFYSYRFDTKNNNFEDFVDTVFDYYNMLDLGKISFLNKILTGKKTDAQLEKLIDSRIYLNGNIFNRAFGNSLTNSLLFIDVLLFRAYLTNRYNLIKHAQLLEYITVNIAYQALNSKETSKSDAKLIQLLASSLTYVDASTTNFNGSYIDMLQSNFTDCEKKYLLDIACLTVWEDHSLDYTESEYIYGLGKDLNRDKNTIEIALKNVRIFFEKNHEKIPYLKDTNLASKFYDGMIKSVSKIILRNSKRLKKELLESKELVLLLTKSTTKELNEEERKKIQSQLIDIFKSIPSLAIFILPGGAVLLPIFIKLIPKLLPSAFDDNRIEENS